jgi:ketosteroid isomerase-like protein
MSQENVEIVEAAFAAFEQGDMQGILRLCDENIVITQSAELPGVSRHQYGHAGVLEAFAIWPRAVGRFFHRDTARYRGEGSGPGHDGEPWPRKGQRG